MQETRILSYQSSMGAFIVQLPSDHLVVSNELSCNILKSPSTQRHHSECGSGIHMTLQEFGRQFLVRWSRYSRRASLLPLKGWRRSLKSTSRAHSTDFSSTLPIFLLLVIYRNIECKKLSNQAFRLYPQHAVPILVLPLPGGSSDGGVDGKVMVSPQRCRISARAARTTTWISRSGRGRR